MIPVGDYTLRCITTYCRLLECPSRRGIRCVLRQSKRSCRSFFETSIELDASSPINSAFAITSFGARSASRVAWQVTFSKVPQFCGLCWATSGALPRSDCIIASNLADLICLSCSILLTTRVFHESWCTSATTPQYVSTIPPHFALIGPLRSQSSESYSGPATDGFSHIPCGSGVITNSVLSIIYTDRPHHG